MLGNTFLPPFLPPPSSGRPACLSVCVRSGSPLGGCDLFRALMVFGDGFHQRGGEGAASMWAVEGRLLRLHCRHGAATECSAPNESASGSRLVVVNKRVETLGPGRRE